MKGGGGRKEGWRFRGKEELKGRKGEELRKNKKRKGRRKDSKGRRGERSVNEGKKTKE